MAPGWVEEEVHIAGQARGPWQVPTAVDAAQTEVGQVQCGRPVGGRWWGAGPTAGCCCGGHSACATWLSLSPVGWCRRWAIEGLQQATCQL